MATAPKAAKPAESKKPEADSDPSKALAESLGQDGKTANGKKTAEKAPPKKLALNEVEGEIKEGAKVRIGIAQFDAPLRESDRVSTAPFIIPRAIRVVGPASRPNTSHAIDVDRPEKTLCRLPTNWTSGVLDHGKDAYIECQPCARRLIAVNKLKQADHDKRRAAFEKAREDAKKAAADQKAAEKAAKDAAKKAETVKAETEKAPAAEAPKGPNGGGDSKKVKPDPKPAAKRTRAKKPAAA